jgi:hypothetical protein
MWFALSAALTIKRVQSGIKYESARPSTITNNPITILWLGLK